jgi:hypothetical protein
MSFSTLDVMRLDWFDEVVKHGQDRAIKIAVLPDGRVALHLMDYHLTEVEFTGSDVREAIDKAMEAERDNEPAL